MKWYFKAFFQYFDFSGRARRKEFWVFTLFNIFFVWLLSIIDVKFNTEYFTTAAYVYSILVLIPTIAVFLRRLHDSGKTGWNLLLILIPILGWIWLLILLIMVGEPKTNRWGRYPKGVENI
jgi:uncharacterized membrane protein YhaH (DUF805 family)